MAGELNTEVLDDPDSCRAAADWLAKLQPGMEHVGDVLHRQKSESESFWQGEAGDLCRGELQRTVQDSDATEQLIEQVKQALLTFAHEIESVRARINEARDRARDKLVVAPTAILPPAGEAPPPPLPQGTDSPDAPARADSAHRAQQAVLAGYRAHHVERQKRFDEVSSIISDAREQQDRAHDVLDKALRDPLERIKMMKTVVVYSTTTSMSYISSAQNPAKDYFKQADRMDNAVEAMETRSANSPSSTTRAGYKQAAATARSSAGDIRTAGKMYSKQVSKVPERARSFISANAGDWISSGSKVGKVSKNVLRGFPFVGTGVTLISGGADIALGKDPGDAAKETGANLVGGAAGSWAGAAIGTAICPGVGTIIGGVAGGVAGGMGATSAVDAATE